MQSSCQDLKAAQDTTKIFEFGNDTLALLVEHKLDEPILSDIYFPSAGNLQIDTDLSYKTQVNMEQPLYYILTIEWSLQAP